VEPAGGIAAVVVTFNRRALLLQCLRCLLAQQNAACDRPVIDSRGAWFRSCVSVGCRACL
jgi:hypothetical protein